MADQLPTMGEILTGVSNFLKAIPDVGLVMNYDEIKEGMNDVPAVQVYPDTGVINATGSTERQTFGSGNRNTSPVRQENFNLIVDVYAAQRSNLGEDLAKCVTLFDLIRVALRDIKERPFFGINAIKSFNWRWERVTFDYNNVKYVGLRFTITVSVY